MSICSGDIRDWSLKLSTPREREFILQNHKYIITKQLLDNVGGGWPEGCIAINAGHPLLHTITTLLHNQRKKLYKRKKSCRSIQRWKLRMNRINSRLSGSNLSVSVFHPACISVQKLTWPFLALPYLVAGGFLRPRLLPYLTLPYLRGGLTPSAEKAFLCANLYDSRS